MGMRAAALGATKLLEPVALATFSEIDETPTSCDALALPSHSCSPHDSATLRCREASWSPPTPATCSGVILQGCMQKYSGFCAVCSSQDRVDSLPLRRDEVSAILWDADCTSSLAILAQAS